MHSRKFHLVQNTYLFKLLYYHKWHGNASDFVHFPKVCFPQKRSGIAPAPSQTYADSLLYMSASSCFFCASSLICFGRASSELSWMADYTAALIRRKSSAAPLITARTTDSVPYTSFTAALSLHIRRENRRQRRSPVQNAENPAAFYQSGGITAQKI